MSGRNKFGFGSHKISDDEYQRLHPVAFALRQAGFIPLPRLWIHGDAMPRIKAITDEFRDQVNEVRGNAIPGQEDYGTLPVSLGSDVTDDPRFSVNAAWEAYESARG